MYLIKWQTRIDPYFLKGTKTKFKPGVGGGGGGWGGGGIVTLT